MADQGRLDELKRKFEENPRRYFAPLANEYRKAGDPELAIELCRTYLPQQPTHMSGYIVYGQALHDAGQTDEAAAVFKQSLTLDPENIIALRHLGDISRAAGDTVGAMRWYGKVLELDPRNEEISAYIDAIANPGTEPATASERRPASPAVRPEPEHDESAVRLEDIVSEPDVVQAPFLAGASEPAGFESSSSDLTGTAGSESMNDIGAMSDEENMAADPFLDQPDEPFQVVDWPSALDPESAKDEELYGAPHVLEGPWHAGSASAESSNTNSAEPQGPPDQFGDDSSAFSSGPHTTHGDQAARGSEPEASPAPSDPPFVTETLAELYVQQGLHGEALAIYRQLTIRRDDPALRARIAELEAQQKQKPAAETVRAFFARIGNARPSERVELAADRASPLAELFGSTDNADDLNAAQRLSGAFGDPRSRESRS